MINKLKEIREKNNISQTDLAYKIGVSQRYIAFLEAGTRTPSLRVAKGISKILKRPIDSIF